MSIEALSSAHIKLHAPAFKAPVCNVRVHLADGLATTVHVVRHERSRVRPRIVVFDEPTVLLDWCIEEGVENAIVGGFDLHHEGQLLGDYWTKGRKHPSESIPVPWNLLRGCVNITQAGELEIGARSRFPEQPAGDLMQVGPVLVQDGVSLMEPGRSPEGFSETAFQFTPDPSVGRHPRAAIGYNDEHVWTVTCDGRKEGEAGLNLLELAEVTIALGVSASLNLDGGSSTQLVRRGRLLNDPWGQHGDNYPEGFPIRSAIAFEPR